MLYVFHVDVGDMLVLDMDLALRSVVELKQVLEIRCKIAPKHQVLLISGGESLDDEEKVCTYTAGTDTNPIFLFSADLNKPLADDLSSLEGTEEQDLRRHTENSLMLPDTQETVSSRAALAQDFVRCSTDQLRLLQGRIHDQHLQHQGWQAVVANLEDSVMALRRRAERWVEKYREYLREREMHINRIDYFDEDIALLNKIPVLPAVLETETMESMVGSVIPNKPFEGDKMSLLEWIQTRASSGSLQQIADSSYRTVNTLTPELLDQRLDEVRSSVAYGQQPSMKEIKGLSERLQGLENLEREASEYCRAQQDHAKAFMHNQQRTFDIRDRSILPDLCASHRAQLKTMADNFNKIVSNRKRITKAKHELSENLHTRMQWVIKAQTMVNKTNGSLEMHASELRRLTARLGVLEQLHTAPSVYIASAVEVVRRKSFSMHFLEKANVLSEKFKGLLEDELDSREAFQNRLGNHFLAKMFPGMEDVPEAFATRKPKVFDDKLPSITLEDVEGLRKEFPDLAESLQLPNADAIAHLLAKSINQQLTQEDDMTLLSLKNMPKKINLSESTGHNRKKTKGKSSYDSDTDSDDDDQDNSSGRRQTPNGSRRRAEQKRKLTQSLPLDDSTLTLEPSSFKNKTPFATFGSNNDKSTSSADPSSSSGGIMSSVAPSSSSDGSVMKQMGEGSVTSQQMQEESKIAALNARLHEAEASNQKMKTGLKNHAKLSGLKEELAALKNQMVQERVLFGDAIMQLKSSLTEQVTKVGDLSQEGHIEALKKAAEEAKERSEKIQELEVKLDLENHKLEDCHREIEMYRTHMRQSTMEQDKIKSEFLEEKEKWKAESEEQLQNALDEANEQKKKLLLDHEFEMESLREAMSQSDMVEKLNAEIKKLKEDLFEKADQVDAYKKKTRMMEKSQEEKFQSEKDKIVQILEAGFAQREKLAVQKCEEALLEKHQGDMKVKLEELNAKAEKEKESIREELRKEAEEKISAFKEEHDNALEKLRQEQRAIFDEAMDKAKACWEEEKVNLLRDQEAKLTMQAKKEVESLRARFKMMQTTGALERSPSASESELSSPRTDVIESIRSSIISEYENNLRLEREKWEKKMEAMKAEHEAAIQQMQNKEKVRDTAEQQVVFNEALKKAVAEKDREIEEMREKNKVLEDSKSESEAKLAEERDMLQAEVKDLKRKAEETMNASVYPVAQQENAVSSRHLELENKRLKEQMTTSMHAELKKGAVITMGCTEGDKVMIVWSEEYSNYMIYLQGEKEKYLHFVHTESLEPLGIAYAKGTTPEKRYTTAQVVAREFCQAKKAGNRFKVPQGAQFYRVKCKPAESN